MKNEVSCKEVMNHVCESLGEDLNSDQCRNIKSHLDECTGCQNYFISVEKTIEFYKNYNIEITEDAHNRLMSYLGLSDEK
jgi:hypothetical protein